MEAVKSPKRHIEYHDGELRVTVYDGYAESGDFFLEIRDDWGARIVDSHDREVGPNASIHLTAYDLGSLAAAAKWAIEMHDAGKARYPEDALVVLSYLSMAYDLLGGKKMIQIDGIEAESA